MSVSAFFIKYQFFYFGEKLVSFGSRFFLICRLLYQIWYNKLNYSCDTRGVFLTALNVLEVLTMMKMINFRIKYLLIYQMLCILSNKIISITSYSNPSIFLTKTRFFYPKPIFFVFSRRVQWLIDVFIFYQEKNIFLGGRIKNLNKELVLEPGSRKPLWLWLRGP